MTPTRTENLFRRQALEALALRPFGQPISRAPTAWRWITLLIVCLAVVGSSLVMTMEYSRKEFVRGWLVSEHGVARLRHDAASRVEEVLFAAGDFVRTGDTVMVLSDDRFMDDGRSAAEVVQAEIGAQIDSNRKQEQLLEEEAGIERETIGAQLRSLEQEVGAVVQQRNVQLQRVEAANAKLGSLTEAARGGAATDWEVLRQKDELIALQQRTSQLQQVAMSLEREQHALRARLRHLPIENKSAVSALRAQRSRLQQQLTESKSRRRVALKAPISGKLASVEVSSGVAIAPRQPLATILPEELRLMAEVYIPSRAAGFIRPGQEVRLKYDAFPHRQFGAHSGLVASVSDFVLLPSEIPQTFVMSEATFKVRIAIERQRIAVAGRRATLRPGMLLGAEIILERRTVADWLLEPLRLRFRDSA